MSVAAVQNEKKQTNGKKGAEFLIGSVCVCMCVYVCVLLPGRKRYKKALLFDPFK